MPAKAPAPRSSTARCSIRGVAGTDRLRQITDAVREAGSMGVAELAGLTGASEMTVRRDLEVLAAQGVLERYRGGARSLLLRGEEPPFALRAQEGLEAKRRIAAEAARLIADGESVVLDSGTTCLEVARALEHRRLTVLPLSLHAVNPTNRKSTRRRHRRSHRAPDRSTRPCPPRRPSDRPAGPGGDPGGQRAVAQARHPPRLPAHQHVRGIRRGANPRRSQPALIQSLTDNLVPVRFSAASVMRKPVQDRTATLIPALSCGF
jgi:hypothetical protein